MEKFNVGDKVVSIIGSKLYRGVVKSTYSDLEICVVEFENGEVSKMPFHVLAHEPKTETSEQLKNDEPKNDTPRVSPETEITLTEKQFEEACVRLIVSESGDITSKILGMIFAEFCGRLGNVLFATEDPHG